MKSTTKLLASMFAAIITSSALPALADRAALSACRVAAPCPGAAPAGGGGGPGTRIPTAIRVRR